MKIISIKPILEPGYAMGHEACIYGLGDDNKMYYWDHEHEKWELYSALTDN